jgi:calcium-dependent protein kinase
VADLLLCRQSILIDKLNFKRSCWEGISDEAKDFVAQLLNRDPAKRPTAKQALKHPWLRGSAAERSTGRPLSLKVVQRIQACLHLLTLRPHAVCCLVA